MSMVEFFELGYQVVVGSMWGDVKMQSVEDCEWYAEDSAFDHVDEDAHVVYFYDSGDYDE